MVSLPLNFFFVWRQYGPCGAGGYFGSSVYRFMQGIYLGISLAGNTLKIYFVDNAHQ